MKKYTQIKGLSDRRRLPRKGKIRLGIKKVASSGKEYPAEVDYFVCPPEVQRVYGAQPKELDIMLPVEDLAVSFPQAYEMYGSSRGLKCTGDGETALRRNEETGDMEPCQCPCPELDEGGHCKQRAHLFFFLPAVHMGGVYELVTSSINSIIDLNSSMDLVRHSLATPDAPDGRLALVPLKLLRQETITHHDGKKQTHYTLRVELDANLDKLNDLRANAGLIHRGVTYVLPPPDMTNPAADDGAEVVDETTGEVLQHAGPTKAEVLVLFSAAQNKDDVDAATDQATSLPNLSASDREELNAARRTAITRLRAAGDKAVA